MAGSILGASAELTGEAAKWAARSGSDRVGELGKNVIHRLQPNRIPPEVLETLPPDFLAMMERQAFLKEHGIGRVAMVGDLMDPDDILEDEAKLKARAALRAQTLVDLDLARPDTAVELRPVTTRQTVDDPVLYDRFNARFEKGAWFMRRTLAHDYDVTSIPVLDPMTPVESEDSPIDTNARRATWKEVTTGLIGWSEQLDEPPKRRPAMVNFMGGPLSSAILEDWEGEIQFLQHYGVLILKRVATYPEDNLLVPAGPTEISLEDPDDPDPSPIWTP